MEPWLELRSGAPGLDGPFLLERRLGYQIFDERAEQPDVFLAIGGKTKRRFLRRLRAGPSVKHNGVIIEEILSSTILLDCELHDSTLPRIKAEPYIESCPRHHLLTTTISDISTPQEIARCAFDFVWQALVPFSSTIVVFMDDLGGLVQLSDILATWAARPTQSQPRIVVLHDAQLRVNQGHFETMVLRKLGARLLQLELLGSPRRRRMPFESVHFLPINNASAVDILSHIDRASAIRRKMGLAFRSQHLTDLLHQSIKQFAAAEPAPFDLYTTARRCNPVSKSLASNITHFLAISRNLHFDRPSVIASALVLDALPPGMHAFLPGSMFDHFYHDILASVDAALGLSLSASTRARFIQLVEERRDKSTHVQHVSFIAKQQGLWMNCQSTEICLVCLARPPRRRLSCGHRLCDACVIMCELVPLPSADWPRDYCPLCQKKNSIELILRPATAGVRALKLGGTLQSTAAMVDFLRQLQYHIGLPLHALRKQFDMVIGSDIGVFFAQTIFLEGWTIAESGHHVNKLAEPNLTKRSTISFGKGLEWDLETTRLFNELDVTLKVKDMIYSNTNNTD
ncbi:hypothetical protein BKA67DRAFT_595054 [Truncatella angustata]|uniref:RING-type domain-containing protein n=1 Tax=Truncatella angustata TaxID=152316 RepID=A0A9P8UC18_9PEZI|nr:uncharacterized protein BKA67DRAFT_595054 [Truncatella angustata]KAH6646832.1 hypothetical protein BKA67DRAFT_595054 [Truncatella angustata]